jgi:hypothetical protein
VLIATATLLADCRQPGDRPTAGRSKKLFGAFDSWAFQDDESNFDEAAHLQVILLFGRAAFREDVRGARKDGKSGQVAWRTWL